MTEKNTLEYEQLRKILPHAYPFILIDRVEDYKAGESLVAVKNVTGNEWAQDNSMFNVKFFPETLMIEAAAQAAIVLYHVTKVMPGEQRPRYYLGRTKAEFFDLVKPGDEIKLKMANGKIMDAGGYTDATLSVGSTKIADLELIFKVERSHGNK